MDKSAFPTVDTEKMMRLPVGAISPLWLMFAGAATVGAAWYWSRTFFKPTNLEALIGLPDAALDAAAPTRLFSGLPEGVTLERMGLVEALEETTAFLQG